MEPLSAQELVSLVMRVFCPSENDKSLAFLVDLPDQEVSDHPLWLTRREIAFEWYQLLQQSTAEHGLQVHFYLYRNVRTNNADLPASAWLYDDLQLPLSADELDSTSSIRFEDIFRTERMLIAPTQFSATAPLKVAARQYGFRAATMPGFSEEMVPALRLDYTEVNRRVDYLKQLLDRAEGAQIVFSIPGKEDEHELFLDLRHRTAHASGGILDKDGLAGNLPSGETYIVPYEGELEGEPSRSSGTLPVQFGAEILYYTVQNNRAIGVLGTGPKAREESAHLAEEPAYGNLAELGLGVLADFGVAPIGEILLDEKLGPHIAFGRSDHFGGQVGPAQFSSPQAVIHIDRVYIPETQPNLRMKKLELTFADREPLLLVRDGRYAIDFSTI